MASKEDEEIVVILSRLDTQIKSGQRKKALKTVDEGLKLRPRDKDLLQAKVFLLVDLDRIQDAYALINQRSPTVGADLGFEKAYCLYRLGELQKALEALEQLDSKHVEAKTQLNAQLCYRLGDYEAAMKLYDELFSQQKVTGVSVKTNIIAAYTAGNRHAEVERLKASAKISPEDGFEVAFNLACSTLQSGKIKEAKDCLLLALRIGKESLLDEDYTEEQADQELAPLNAQLAYVNALSAQQEDALNIYQELLSSDVTDEGLRALSTSNRNTVKLLLTPPDKQRQIIAEAVKQSDTFFDKGLSSLKLKASVEQRLSLAQQQVLTSNRVLLQLLAGRQQSAKDLTQQLAKRYKDSAGVALLRASLLARDNKLKEAESVLASASDAGDAPQELTLMRAQLAVDNANNAQASSIIDNLPSGELRGKPAMVATQTALLEASKQEAAALDLVLRVQASSAANKQMSKAEKAEITKGLLPIVARLQLKTGAVSEAFKTFKQLHSLDASTASSAAVVGQLAAAALDHDPAAASSLQGHLQNLPEMQEQDVDKLEAAGTSRMAKGDAGTRAGKASGGDNTAAKRKRKRKTQLPKNFDPENPGPPPDPEHWLPKWQRTEYKKKRRNRKEKSKIGHQGGAVDESLDRTNTETPASAPAPPNVPRRARGRGKGSRR